MNSSSHFNLGSRWGGGCCGSQLYVSAARFEVFEVIREGSVEAVIPGMQFMLIKTYSFSMNIEAACSCDTVVTLYLSYTLKDCRLNRGQFHFVYPPLKLV